MKIVSNKRFKVLEDNEKEIWSLQRKNKDLEGELEVMKDRVRSVEDAYQEKTGLNIRVETTKVFAKFDKIEMITMMSGLHKLMKSSESTGDITYYTDLIKKLQGFIDHMEDPKDE